MQHLWEWHGVREGAMPREAGVPGHGCCVQNKQQRRSTSASAVVCFRQSSQLGGWCQIECGFQVQCADGVDRGTVGHWRRWETAGAFREQLSAAAAAAEVPEALLERLSGAPYKASKGRMRCRRCTKAATGGWEGRSSRGQLRGGLGCAGRFLSVLGCMAVGGSTRRCPERRWRGVRGSLVWCPLPPPAVCLLPFFHTYFLSSFTSLSLKEGGGGSGRRRGRKGRVRVCVCVRAGGGGGREGG